MIVVGADLSLAGSALATRDTVHQLTTKGRKADRYPERLTRLRLVTTWCTYQLTALHPDLIVLEAPAPNAVQRISVWDRAHVWWHVVDFADAAGIPIAYAPPPNLKKYATGNGRAEKRPVLDAARARLPQRPIRNDNDADAAWLCAMGHHWLGAPLVPGLPDTHTKSLAGVLWPGRPLPAEETQAA